MNEASINELKDLITDLWDAIEEYDGEPPKDLRDTYRRAMEILEEAKV